MVPTRGGRDRWACGAFDAVRTAVALSCKPTRALLHLCSALDGRGRLLWRIRLVLLLPLLLFLLQFFLRGVMSDCATGRGAQHGMMTGHVTRYGAYRRTFDATFRHGGLRANGEGQDDQQR
jgi:hypothetical protein